ncbi:MAG: hypothetical protein Q4A70_00725 [Candidatus Saccharibacteria bacterium]|nr:hypothetical protein [Candidatus Saccharibacteria bacterium]
MSLKELLNLPALNLPKFPFLRDDNNKYTNKLTYDDLINAESELGRTLFGPIPAGHQREFFEAKKNVWIWHESYLDQTGSIKEMTIRYEVRPAGVYKKVQDGIYKRIEGQELNNFRKAAKSYLDLVKSKLYC